MTVSESITTALLIPIASPVSGRIAPGNAAKGPFVGPAPFKCIAFEPNANEPALIRVSCALELIVKPAVAVGWAAKDTRMRPPLRIVGPVYNFAPVPNVASPSPCLVKPPGPEIVAVKFSAPAADDAVMLFTVATSESARNIGAEIVLFPVPTAAGTAMAAGPIPVSSNASVPLAPVVSDIVNAFAPSLLKVIEPTTCGASTVTVRLAVCAGLNGPAALFKIALAPVPFGCT